MSLTIKKYQHMDSQFILNYTCHLWVNRIKIFCKCKTNKCENEICCRSSSSCLMEESCFLRVTMDWRRPWQRGLRPIKHGTGHKWRDERVFVCCLIHFISHDHLRVNLTQIDFWNFTLSYRCWSKIVVYFRMGI